MADVENVIIIGIGPAGYTAALYTARANLNPLVIEGFLWGGLLQQTTDVENYPGYPQGIMGPEMMQQFRDQAERFGTRFITDNVTKFEPGADGEPHTVWIDDEAYKARAVILAMGAEHKKLGVPGEEELGGRGVSYCATCDAAFYKDRTTIIVGGGDSAMEEAIFLAKFSSKVTIVNRRDEFRASKIMLERARATENIEFLTPYTVDAFLRRRERPARSQRGCATPRPARRASCRCRARSSRSATSRSRRSSTGIVEIDDEGYVKTEGKSTRTNVPGVFGAGDLVDTPTARPSRPPAPAVRPRSTPSGTCATTPLFRPPRPSKAPATWPSSSGRPPRARSGGARRRGPRGLRRRRRRRSRADLPRGARHDQVLARPTSRTAARSRSRSPATARASRRRSSGARCPPGSVELVLVVEDPDARRHLHPLDGLAASPPPPAPAWRPTASSRPALKEGKNSAGKDGWTPPCPPEGRRRPPLHLHALRARRRAPTLEAGADPEAVAARARRARSPAAPSPGTYKRGSADAQRVLALLVARVALRADRDVVRALAACRGS